MSTQQDSNQAGNFDSLCDCTQENMAFSFFCHALAYIQIAIVRLIVNET